MTDQFAENISGEVREAASFAGAFKRFLAFFVDFIILNMIAVAITYPFSNFISQNPEVISLITFLFIFIYFGIFDSKKFSGKSPGKRLFKIQLIQSNETYLTPKNAGLRALILQAPIIVYGLIDLIRNMTALSWLINLINIADFILYSLYLGNVFFLIFHPQKCGIHDLIFKTCVIKKGKITNYLGITLKPIIAAVIGSLSITSIFIFVFFSVSDLMKNNNNPTGNDLLEPLEAFRRKVENKTQKYKISKDNIGIHLKTSSFKSTKMAEGEITNSIIITIQIASSDFNDNFKQEIFSQLYPLAASSPDLKNLNFQNVVIRLIVQEYIGIMSYSRTENHPKSVKEILNNQI